MTMGEGNATPDLETKAAIDDCDRGNTAAGIPVLERKLRSKGFTPPKRPQGKPFKHEQYTAEAIGCRREIAAHGLAVLFNELFSFLLKFHSPICVCPGRLKIVCGGCCLSYDFCPDRALRIGTRAPLLAAGV